MEIVDFQQFSAIIYAEVISDDGITYIVRQWLGDNHEFGDIEVETLDEEEVTDQEIIDQISILLREELQ